MSNIHLKVTIEEKNWRFQNFDLPGLKKMCHQVSFGELQLMKISLNFQTSCCDLKNRGSGAKLCVTFVLF